MKYTFFITGFPGFLARNLVQQLLNDYQDNIKHFYLLTLPAELSTAREVLNQSTYHSIPRDRYSIISGDITKTNLAIETNINRQLQEKVTHVFHLAAIYDLAVPFDIAWKVNVYGTKNVNNWLKTLGSLNRYIYFSTAYVSGTRQGTILETELDMKQTFKNHYEATKYEAEVLVETLKEIIPTTIIRPGIVKGHSKTGYTEKFDGIYFLLNMFERMKLMKQIPFISEGNVEGNFVPYDYVLKATSYLGLHPIGEDKTYHLTDPIPYTMRQLYQMIAEIYLNVTPNKTISLSLASYPLSFSFIRKWLQTEKEALAYFENNCSYSSAQAARDLENTTIRCPDFKDQLQPMIDFYQKYKDDYQRHVIIT
ncbi:SDR family oxidoreductase [Oceanobacillus kimchii]|uniref:3-beta hydroxysteroid dehydrogenase n=1 Tax=Oceanobacillus kimchii TaxID=746691 RepID=A0ABQ5TLV6_9BACI|nr:SDR family oxidoreductase [Oceanobacillus kimchii]GLO65517.1 3-beta hydroxysteroid dehydrogenase [Oceanobacillus kimchii]